MKNSKKIIEKYLERRNDKKIIKKYLNMKYPNQTHLLNLYDTFDYIAGLCIRFLRYPKCLDYRIIGFSKEEIIEIEKLINFYENEDINYLRKFYHKTSEAILILKKYYNEDGIRK